MLMNLTKAEKCVFCCSTEGFVAKIGVNQIIKTLNLVLFVKQLPARQNGESLIVSLHQNYRILSKINFIDAASGYICCILQDIAASLHKQTCRLTSSNSFSSSKVGTV